MANEEIGKTTGMDMHTLLGQHETRIAQHETEIREVKTSISNLDKNMRFGFRDISQKIEASNDKAVASSKPDFRTWIGFVAVLLVIIGMVGSGYVRDQNRIEDNLIEHMKSYREYVYNTAPKDAAQFERIEATTKTLKDHIATDAIHIRNLQDRDNLLQKEFREDLAARERRMQKAIEDGLFAQDTRLQREMIDKIAIVAAQVKYLEEQNNRTKE